MKYLGYTEEEFKIAGDDACNYQGVGNPHIYAKIQPGEKVLDLGSGLGVDSFIAAHYTGPKGKVIGLDISAKEVKHAQARAEARGLDIRFVNADIEDIPLPDNMIDVIISNGAFCLVPSKEKAFKEIFRVLRPGGRMAICTSTVKANLEPGVSWPVCMRMFEHIDNLEPICKSIGFEEFVLDDSNSLMQYELPSDVVDEPSPNRNQVHVGSEEFKHLQDFDMNKICARVTVFGKKPE
jgi:SAM-dependent methyltransferase